MTPAKLLALTLVLTVSLQPAAAQEEEREGGLTGTGIVGEITALGSIIVNGQRITFDEDLPVTSALGSKKANALVPGDIVAVAVEPADIDWDAIAIAQAHALIGPVTDASENSFTTLGVVVRWPNPPSPGTWVAVSGFWTAEGVQATAIQTIDPRDTISIQGSYSEDQERETTRVGTRSLDLATLHHASEGDVIRITGTLLADRIAVTDVHRGLFAQPVSLVLAEGYFSSVAPSGHYTVGGSGLSSYTDNQKSIMQVDRVRVCGTKGQLGVLDTQMDAGLLQRLGCSDL